MKETFEISPSCPVKIAIQAPVLTLYTLEVESALHVTSRVPVALKLISNTSSTWPLSVSTQEPDATSQILQVLLLQILYW